ncbi:MAG: hypothetical protein ACJ8R9_10940 [Steroidobacteraceae bacterium]
MAELMTRPFLTVNEMESPQASFSSGYGLGSNMKSNIDTQNQKNDFKKISELEFKTIQDSVSNAANQAQTSQTAPGSQPLPQATPAQGTGSAPVPAASAPQATVPTGAVARPQQATAGAAPQAPASAPAAPNQPAQPTAAAPVDASVPTPVAAQPASVATPTPSAQPAASQGQQSNAHPVEQQLRTAPVIGNGVNTISDSVYQARVQGVTKMVQDGTISAASGKAYIDTMTAARDARIKSAVDISDKLSQINERDTNAQEKKVATASAIRKEQDNQYAQVYQVLKQQGPDVAQQYAKELGIGVDLTKTTDLSTLETRAKRSDTYKDLLASQKGEQENAQGKMNDSEIPPGWRNVGGAWIKPNGERASGAEIESAIGADQAFKLAKSRAGATNVTVGQENAFAKGVGEGDAKNLESINNDLNISKDAFRNYKQINDIVTKNPNIIAGPGGGIKTLIKRVTGSSDDKSTDLFARDMVKQAQANLDLSQARANKGQGSLSDSERALMQRAASGDTNFTGPELQVFAKAMMKTEQIKQKNLNSHIDSIQKRNPKTDVTSYKQDLSSDSTVDSASSPAEAAGVVPTQNIAAKYAKYAVGGQ